MYIEIPATTVKSRNLQEFLQELAGICRNVRNLQEYQESGIPAYIIKSLGASLKCDRLFKSFIEPSVIPNYTPEVNIM